LSIGHLATSEFLCEFTSFTRVVVSVFVREMVGGLWFQFDSFNLYYRKVFLYRYETSSNGRRRRRVAEIILVETT